MCDNVSVTMCLCVGGGGSMDIHIYTRSSYVLPFIYTVYATEVYVHIHKHNYVVFSHLQSLVSYP